MLVTSSPLDLRWGKEKLQTRWCLPAGVLGTKACLSFNLVCVLSGWHIQSFLSCDFVLKLCSFPPYRHLCLPELPCSPDKTGDPGDPYQRAPAAGVQRL